MNARMTKRECLERAVVAAIEHASDNVMQWGVDDCALWCANVVRDALGYDPAMRFRGRYKTRLGALKKLRRGGLKSALFDAARRHGWKRINPANARPGDVALAWTQYSGKPVFVTAICRASGWFVARNEKGFTAFPGDRVAAAWSVLPDCVPGSRVGMPRLSTRPKFVETSAAVADPVSDAIGLSALINSALGAAAVAGGVGTAVGGLIVGGVVGVCFSSLASVR